MDKYQKYLSISLYNLCMEEFSSYFKYCSDNIDVVNGIFRDQKIRFTQPWGMNDPLEFNPSLQLANDAFAHQSYELDGISLPSLDLFYRLQIIESQINAYGILSLTKLPLSFDMWSRYANGHKGFVLELMPDFNLNISMKSKDGKDYQIKKVEYVQNFVLNVQELAEKYDEIPFEILQNEFFFKKTSRWKDEEEYRLVRSLGDYPGYKQISQYSHRDESFYLFKFPRECIKSVIFGACMSVKTKVAIINYCKDWDVLFYQAYIFRNVPDEFGKPGKVGFFSIIDYLDSLEEIGKIKPQLLCMDSGQNNFLHKKKITSLAELPYYEDYKDLVDKLIKNISRSEK